MNFLSFHNSKLKGEGIYTFDLPPSKTCGAVGCEFNNGCDCYAMKSNYLRCKTTIDFRHNLLFAATKDKSFVDQFCQALKFRRKKYHKCPVRLLGVGEIYSQKLLNDFTKIIERNPDTPFYAYTKALHLNWEKTLKLPNFTRIQSHGGKFDHLIDTDLPNAKVFDSIDEMKLSGYTDCTTSDLKALSTTNIGLLKR